MLKKYSPITKLNVIWKHLPKRGFPLKSPSLFSMIYWISDAENFDNGNPAYKSYKTYCDIMGCGRNKVGSLIRLAVKSGFVTFHGKSQYGTLILRLNQKLINEVYDQVQILKNPK